MSDMPSGKRDDWFFLPGPLESFSGIALLLIIPYLAVHILPYLIVFEIRFLRKYLYVSLLFSSVTVPLLFAGSLAGYTIWGTAMTDLIHGDYYLVGLFVGFLIVSYLGYVVLSNRQKIRRYIWGPPLFSNYPF